MATISSSNSTSTTNIIGVSRGGIKNKVNRPMPINPFVQTKKPAIKTKTKSTVGLIANKLKKNYIGRSRGVSHGGIKNKVNRPTLINYLIQTKKRAIKTKNKKKSAAKFIANKLKKNYKKKIIKKTKVKNNKNTNISNTGSSLHWLPTATVHSFSLINDANRDLTEAKFDRFMSVLDELNDDKFLEEQDTLLILAKGAGLINRQENRGRVDSIKRRLQELPSSSHYKKLAANKYDQQFKIRADKEKRYDEYIRQNVTADPGASEQVGKFVLDKLNTINQACNRSPIDISNLFRQNPFYRQNP